MVADTPSRLGAVDILRGFALLGRILVHVRGRSQDAGGLLDLFGWAVYVGVESKSWATFAFLFGVGFALQLRSAQKSGRPFVATYLRRLAALYSPSLAPSQRQRRSRSAAARRWGDETCASWSCPLRAGRGPEYRIGRPVLRGSM